MDKYGRSPAETFNVALHEAGHAVMHVFLKMDNLDSISIVPDGACEAGSGGRVTARFYPALC